MRTTGTPVVTSVWLCAAVASTLALGSAPSGCITRGELDALKKGQEDLMATTTAMQADVAALRKAAEARPLPAAAAAPRQLDAAKVYSVAVGQAPSLGPDHAPVTVVAVSDFQCPYCKMGRDRLREVVAAYGKDVRLVFKHNPLSMHARAMPAAIAAQCAMAQKKFWPYHDLLFDNQAALGDVELADYAKQLGLDRQKFARCLADPSVKKYIEADQAAMRTLGATATPSFFINGRFISGARGLSVFRALIDEELKKARDSGIDAAAYYQKVVVDRGERSM